MTMNDSIEITPIVAERVERGALLLDEKDPGWAEGIDLDVFDITSCENCIVGQRFASYLSGLRALGLNFMLNDDVAYGFCHEDMEHKELEAAWVAEIKKRRAVA